MDKHISNIFITYLTRHSPSVTSSTFTLYHFEQFPIQRELTEESSLESFYRDTQTMDNIFSHFLKMKTLQLYFPWVIPRQLNLHFLSPSMLRDDL